MSSQKETIVNLINTKGISEEHKSQIPIWGKYSKNVRSGNERAFLIFSDGNLYNYSTGDGKEAATTWNDWKKIKKEDLDKILNEIQELDQFLEGYQSQEMLNDTNIIVQYKKQNQPKIAIISKDYDSESGAYLKKINDLVNIGLANRNK